MVRQRWPSHTSAGAASRRPRYLRDKQEWSLYEDKSENPQQKLNVPPSPAAPLRCAELMPRR